MAANVGELAREVATEHRALTDRLYAIERTLTERLHLAELALAAVRAELAEVRAERRLERIQAVDYRTLGFSLVGGAAGLTGMLKAFGLL